MSAENPTNEATSDDDSNNVAIAFALTIGAGAATALGAAVVFIPWAVKYADRKTLAASLGLSAGVMTYVSFVEIFQKSIVSFLASGMSKKETYRYATICFFAGVTLMVVLNKIVTRLLYGDHHHHHSHGGDITPPGNCIHTNTKSTDSTQENNNNNNNAHAQQKENEPHDLQSPPEPVVGGCMCCSEDPARDLESLQQMAEEVQVHQHNESSTHDHGGHDHFVSEENEDELDDSVNAENAKGGAKNEDSDEAHNQAKLMRMSINTAIAIGLHNFPEGLATFVATLNDPRVGGVLAVAIAIHNIPEGLCVAMPIYYATGKRWNAFAWACLSGASEPIAAVLGWAVLANSFSDAMYAVLFAMVAGMMVIISTRELLPTAHRYDPDDTVVTYSFIGGMMIMAASLVMFAETK